MKYHILLGFLAVAAAYPGVIHDEGPQLEEKADHHAVIGETGHHHAIEHDHAKSHQSIKFEHFYPVPVYVKKEHSHLLKHPLEKGKSEQNLKLIHPETQHNYGGGLVLEDNRHDSEHFIPEHGGFHQGDFEHGSFAEGGFHHASFDQSGGFGANDGLKEYAHLQHSGFIDEHGQVLGGDAGGDGYKFNSY